MTSPDEKSPAPYGHMVRRTHTRKEPYLPVKAWERFALSPMHHAMRDYARRLFDGRRMSVSGRGNVE